MDWRPSSPQWEQIPSGLAHQIYNANNVLRDGWGLADVWYINTAEGRKNVLAQDLKTRKWWAPRNPQPPFADNSGA